LSEATPAAAQAARPTTGGWNHSSVKIVEGGMKKVLIVPVLAAVLSLAGCDGDPTTADTAANVRFFNATTGMAGSGAFTANGQFATGSALAYGQSTQTCSRISEGTASFGFGAANTGGTALNGSALATLNNQTLTAGGNYTMVATGSATSPQLYLLDNSFTGSVGTNQAAVRFVNLEPGPATLPNIFYAFTSWPPVEGSLFAASLLVGSPSEFKLMTSGTTSFSVIIGHQVETLSTVPVTLQGGSVNTIAIVANPAGGHQLINIPRC
jgi:hypothetical protein